MRPDAEKVGEEALVEGVHALGPEDGGDGPEARGVARTHATVKCLVVVARAHHVDRIHACTEEVGRGVRVGVGVSEACEWTWTW